MGADADMQKKLADFYGRIGSALISELPKDWDQAIVGYFKPNDEPGDLMVYIRTKGSKVWHDFMDDVYDAGVGDDAYIMEGIFDCKDYCCELYDYCKQAEKKWTSFTMIVDSEGYYRVDLGYDDGTRAQLKAAWTETYLKGQ